MMSISRISLAGASLAVLFSAVACGGGGSAAPAAAPPPPAASTVTLSGVAATGAPLVAATVHAQCASGANAASLPTSSTGEWTLEVPAAALPCALEASGGTVSGAPNTVSLHSIAAAAGVTNITPLTDLAIARAAGKSPSEWFAALAATPSGPTLDAHAASVQLLAAFTAAGYALPPGSGFDPFTTAFEARAGDAYDHLLDILHTALARDSRTYADLVVQFVAGLGSAITLPQAAAPVVTDPGSQQGSPVVLTAKGSAAAADIAPLVGTYHGTLGRIFSTGQDTVETTSCTIAVAADGTMTVSAGTRSIAAAVNGDVGDVILSVLNLYRIQASDTANDRYAQLTTVRGWLAQGVARQGGTGFTTATDRVECLLANPAVTTAGTTDKAVLEGATAADISASWVGTYAGNGCSLTISNAGVLHFTGGGVDMTTQLGGDENDVVVVAGGSTGIQAQDYFSAGVENYIFVNFEPGSPSLGIAPSYSAEVSHRAPRPFAQLATCNGMTKQ